MQGHLIRRVSTSARIAIVVLTLALPLSGCALLIAGGVAGGVVGGAAAAKESQHESHSAGAYAGTVLANVLYVPTKVVFAGAGAIASGVTYVVTLGSSSATSSVWDSTVGGDYVVTPRMIEGRDPVRFVGDGRRETTVG